MELIEAVSRAHPDSQFPGVTCPQTTSEQCPLELCDFAAVLPGLQPSNGFQTLLSVLFPLSFVPVLRIPSLPFSIRLFGGFI